MIEDSGFDVETTSNRMEITAAVMGLSRLTEPCSVRAFSDSQYVVKGMSSWIKGWKKRGWKTQSGEDVKNRDLWKRLDALCKKHSVTWKWIKGHSGHPQNERCDELAVAAYSEAQPQSRQVRGFSLIRSYSDVGRASPGGSMSDDEISDWIAHHEEMLKSSGES